MLQIFRCPDKCCKFSCARTNAANFHAFRQMLQILTCPDKCCKYSGARTNAANFHMLGQMLQIFTYPDKCCNFSCARTNAANFHAFRQTLQIFMCPDKCCNILPIRERPRRIGRPALLDRQTGTDAHTRGRRALSYIRSPEILPGGYSWPRPAISVHRIYFPVDIAGLGPLYPFTGYTSR